ncbi:Kelch repeat-containing protein [Gemmatimonadota bacterium]
MKPGRGPTIAALILVVNACGSGPSEPSDSRWKSGTSLTATLFGHAAAVIDDRLYVVGGDGNSGLKIYDPVTDSWSGIPRGGCMERARATAGVIQGKLYVIGDYRRPQMFDPQTELWTDLAWMPSPRTRAGVGVVEDKLYVFGGMTDYGDTTSTPSVQVYDPVADSWTTNFMPEGFNPGSDPAVGVIDDIIYVAARSQTFSYDPHSGTFTDRQDRWLKADGCAHGVIDGKLYVAGGWCWNPGDWFCVPISNFFVYDPEADSWTEIEQVPAPRAYSAGGVIDGILYVVGGQGWEGYARELYFYTP